MSDARWLAISHRWFRLLARLYPPDFRDEMGIALVEAYMDSARDTLKVRGRVQLMKLWLRALIDSFRNGPGEHTRPAASWRRSGDWGRDIELVRRRLVRSPLFTASTIGTLTVGLGMFAFVFTAVQRVLLDPMPYKDPGDLYYVWRDYGPAVDVARASLGGPDIVELQKSTAVIQSAAGIRPMLGGIFSFREGSEPMEIPVAHTSPNFFDMLGVKLALGRSYTPEESSLGPGREQVIVLTHQLWSRLGADPRILGTEVRLQGRPHTVIGVLPRDFAFVRGDASAPPQRVDAYIPFDEDLAKQNPRNEGYAGLIRVRRGSGPEAVAAAVADVGRIIEARDFGGRGLKLYPVGLKADTISRIHPALVALGAAGMVLVFMLMVNLASVLLARVSQREHELAVSRALGADTAAILRSTLLEGGVLGLAGGMLGALVASWGTRALVALAPLDLPRREAIALDWRIALAVCTVGVLLGVFGALAPAAWAARTSLSSLLAGSSVRGGGGQGRWRRGMIVAQVALSFVLLSSGALVARSFERLLRADPGFQPEGVFTVKVRTPPEFFPKQADAIGFQDRVQDSLASIPGVSVAGAASALPLTATGVFSSFQISITAPGAPGNTGDAERDKLVVDLIGSRYGYVETMGIRVVAGRSFDKLRPTGVAEAMIDTAVARRFFPDGSALGSQIRLGSQLLTIVGVVRQARLYGLYADGRPQVLVRAENFGMRPLFYVVKTTRDPHSLLPDVTAAVRRIEPRVAVGDPRSMDDLVQASRGPQAMGASLVGSLALGALLLTAMGLFGVVAGSVTRRRHELAVRLAVGADHQRVLRLVLAEGAVLVSAGLLIGAPGIYFGYRMIRGLLVGVSPYDPLALIAAAVGLFVVAMVACYVPARRVLKIDPAQMLHQ
jgi:putative ABC transport system permease protein